MVWLINMVSAILLAIFRGYVMVSLWGWFVLTQFPMVPHISIVGAIGLSCFIGLFHNYATDDEKLKDLDEDERAVHLFKTLVKGFFYTLISWGGAFLVHLFM